MSKKNVVSMPQPKTVATITGATLDRLNASWFRFQNFKLNAEKQVGEEHAKFQTILASVKKSEGVEFDTWDVETGICSVAEVPKK